MALDVGARLGPYEILSPLGVGGMGEVYKARDTRLDRIVAVKVLPEALAADPQFRERFDREARTISQLDHPNICALYDVGDQDGTAFLVMQYLEGETLDARLKPRAPTESAVTRGPDGTRGFSRALAIEDALRIAIEIADALDKAHRAGIVHRDLKPANIFLARTSASGPPVAKLLDFGLAKTAQSAVGAASGTVLPTALPTTPANITVQGTILGTFQYMAPEQLEGVDADARTDIFAFGAVVYEMLTGRKAFDGRSQVSLIGAILEREPAPIGSLVPTVPPTLDRIVKRCLAKDPDRRWQTASDLAHELRWVAESALAGESRVASVASASLPVARPRSALAWKVVAAVSVLVAGAALAAVYYFGRSVAHQVVRFYIAPPEKMTFVTGGRAGASAAISPDGRRMVFTVREAPQKISLWVRAIDALTAQPLPGTDDASFPFWSPDSRWIAYFAHDKLMKIDANGGPPQTLCAAAGGRGGAWSREGVILFGAGVGPAGTGGPLKRVSSAGGSPVAATKIATGDHRFPSFLPDSRHFFFYTNGTGDQDGVYIGSLDSPESRRIINAESSAVYAAGHALFIRQSTLLAQPFNVKTSTTSGDPVPIAEQVTRNFQGLLAFSVSDSGILTYGIGPTSLTNSQGGVPLQLVWVDRQGKTIGTAGKPAAFRGVDLAPDGKRIATHVHEGTGGDIWIVDDARTDRFTFDPAAENESPVWSPDGEWIAFAKNGAGQKGIYRKRSNNAGSEDLLLASADVTLPQSWSPDGTAIVFSQSRAAGPSMTDLYRLPLSGERKATPLVNDPGNQNFGQVSPDARWLAYSSNEGLGETGRAHV